MTVTHILQQEVEAPGIIGGVVLMCYATALARAESGMAGASCALVTIGVVSSNSLPSDYFPPASSFYSWQYIGLSWRTAPPHTTRQAL